MNTDYRLLFVLVGTLCACPGGGSGDSGDGTADSGGPECFEPFPWEIEGGPGFRNVVSGVERPSSYGTDETYTTVAYGQVDSDASSTYDYAVASKDHDVIYVYYGSSDTGLTVFDDVTRDLWDIGTGGVVDVALSDLDDDGHNELIALTTNDEIIVWPGDNADPWFLDSPTTVGATYSTVATGHSQMLIDDFDCDGHLDIVMPADDGAVIRYGDSMTLLGGGSYHVEMDGETAFELAVDDLDDDNQPDIVASTNAGEIFVLRGGCGNNPYPGFDRYDFNPSGLSSPNPHLAIVRMCGVMGNNPGLAIGYNALVFVMCSDGNADFANVIEPHGEEDPEGLGIDYQWSTLINTLVGDVSAISAFGSHSELIALSGRSIVRLNRASCGYFSGWAQRLSQPLSGGTQHLNHLELVPSSNPANWRRVAVTGNLGLMILQ